MKVKLLYMKSSSRILFMEVGRDVIDLLLSFLAVPFASIIKLLQQQQHKDKNSPFSVGGSGKLFCSIEKLTENIDGRPWPTKDFDPSTLLLCSSEEKGDFMYRCSKCTTFAHVAKSPTAVCPTCRGAMATRVPLTPDELPLYYKCSPYGYSRCRSYCEPWVSRSPSAICPECKQSNMRYPVSFVGSPSSSSSSSLSEMAEVRYASFAKETDVFLVMDDLSIIPPSTIDIITLLSDVKSINDLGRLETVITKEKALELLQATFKYKSVLSNVFSREIPKKCVAS